MTFRRWFLTGLVWVVLAAAVGMVGNAARSSGGFIGILGLLFAILGFGAAIGSLVSLLRAARLQFKGVRMMARDPEGFAALYEDAVRNGVVMTKEDEDMVRRAVGDRRHPAGQGPGEVKPGGDSVGTSNSA